jgi:hypothetical protein
MRFDPVMRALVAAAGLLALGGCRLDVSLDDTEYRCDRSGRCPSGMDCVEGVCQAPGAVADAGGGDAPAGCRVPSVDDVSTARFGLPPATVTTADLSHAVAGSDRLLLAVAGYRATSGEIVTSVTYGGTALTQLCRAAGVASDHYATDVWYLPSPPAGIASLEASFDGAVDSVVLAAVSLVDTDTAAPLGDAACEGGDGEAGVKVPTELAATVSSSSCELVFASATTYVDDNPGDLLNDLSAHEEVDALWTVTDPNLSSQWNTISAGGTMAGETMPTIGWTAERNWAWSVVAVSVAGN